MTGSRLVGRTAVAACLVALLAIPAESGQHRWWKSDKTRAELGLTTAQSGRIDQIFQSSLPAMRTAKRELDREEDRLSNLIARSEATESEVADQIDRVETVRSALSKTRTLMLFRMRRLLTPAQRSRLDAQHGSNHEF